MVLDSLKDRLSSLRGGRQSDSASGDSSEGADGGSSEAATYAQRLEYGVDERDLRDEDKLLRLLVQNGGRVEEEVVVERTGWTEDRLAAVVEEMEDDEQVSAISVGRKRVICRRGFEPKGYRSHLTE
ncbi:MAG: hypothetical protein U5K37_01580 [Natrialbaceae archaeon]|nr:hypothetical protein [Natrialbaceae archaeon]